MARAITDIQQQMLDGVAGDPNLSQVLTSTSKRAIFRLFTYIIAVAINFLEQLIDIFTANVESIAAAAAPGSPAWLQSQVFKFQYSSTSAQVVQFINNAPSYTALDPTLQIITRCGISVDLSNTVQVKVATGTTPIALSSAQLSSLQDYLNQIGFAGIIYNATSGNPDQLYVQATIYFKGQYSAVISANVIAAINNFLALMSAQENFNGTIRLSDLEAAMKAVPGVNDVVFTNVRARDDSTALASASYLVQNELQISRQWATVAGYIISEQTAGNTLADTLTFTAE